MNQTDSLPIIDWGQHSQLASNANDLTRELLLMFASQVPETQTAINQAFLRKDYEELDNRLHKLQGGCVYCGLLRLKDAIVEASKTLRENKALSQASIDQINNELDAVMSELRNKGIV
jgi:two-component system sensor histidine kinase BarA